MHLPLTTIQLSPQSGPKVRFGGVMTLPSFLGSLGLARHRMTVIGSKKYKQARAFFLPIGHKKKLWYWRIVQYQNASLGTRLLYDGFVFCNLKHQIGNK